MLKHQAKFIVIIIKIMSVMFVLFAVCNKDKSTNPVGTKATIKIGFLTEITGSNIITSFNASKLAANEINAAGGIRGMEIEFVLKDSYANSGQAALDAVHEFQSDNINFVIGPGWSSRTLKIADYVTSNNMLLLPISATSPAISDLDDNGLIWRTCPSDAFQAVVASEYIYKELGVKKTAIMYRDDSWGVGLANAFTENFEKLGGTITNSVDYPSEIEDFFTYDFSAECVELLSGHPELIFFASFDDDQFKWLNDLYLITAYQNDKPILFDVEGLNIEDLLVNLPEDMVNNLMAIGYPEDNNDYDNFVKYQNMHIATFPEDEPSFYNSCAYDDVYLLAYAMLKSGSITDPSKVAAELKDISGGVPNSTVIDVNEFTKAKDILTAGGEIDYDGASGRIEFDSNGDPGSATYEIFRVVGLEEVKVKKITYP